MVDNLGISAHVNRVDHTARLTLEKLPTSNQRLGFE
jgi:hypothetical protein